MAKCEVCGDETQDVVEIKSKWVSWGPVGKYDNPITAPCCKGCKSSYLDARSKHYAVLDETMNTHRDFVRVSGQDGHVYGIPCKGWQTAGEVGVPYHVHERYKDYY